MKRRARTLVTYPVMAIAMTSGGCTRPAQDTPLPASESVTVPPAASGAPLAVVPSAASAPSPTVEAPSGGPPPSRRMSDDPALLALRDELRKDGKDKALARVAHYRPLCDNDGYPLVGNVFRKVPTPEYQPSELCAEVRKKR